MLGKRMIACGVIASMMLCFMFVMVPASAANIDQTRIDNSVDVTCDLIAGQHIDIGYVKIWNEGDLLHVMFVVDDDELLAGDGWYLISTKVSVKECSSMLPMTKSGNPIPGKFESKMSFGTPGVQMSEHVIDMDHIGWWEAGGMPFVAAHADACRYGGLMGLEMALPDCPVMIQVSYPVAGGPSYFPQLIVSEGGFLDGIYKGWCVDTDRTIAAGTPYDALVFSSMETLPMGMIEHPENFDLVNWILNQNFVGKMSPGGYGAYTYGDVQKAIWILIEDDPIGGSLGVYEMSRVCEILIAAQNCGEGFMPKCGQIVALIFAPIGICGNIDAQIIIGQVVIGEFGIPCKCQCETAWGEGMSFKEAFGASQWGMFIDTAKPCGC